MRVLVLSDESRSGAPGDDAIAAVLADLGCRVQCARLDLSDIAYPTTDARSGPTPDIAVIDAAGDRVAARGCLARVRACRRLGGVPILLVTPASAVPGLDFALGFDDFILAPVMPAELHARLRQLDGRTAAAFGSDEIIKLGDLVVDVVAHEARIHGHCVPLTHREFALLAFLGRNAGRVYTRAQILQHVWSHDYKGGARTVDIHIRRVRAKLGPVAGGLIETVRHVGYKLRPAP